MRLVSIYINKHDFLFDEPQTVNFGGEYIYNFSLDKNELMLERKKNPDYIDGFWGNSISLVSAIVGANGAGKTNLSVEIYDDLKSFSIDYKRNIDILNSLHIFEDNEKTILIYKFHYVGKHGSDEIRNKELLRIYGVSKDIVDRSSVLKSSVLKFKNNLAAVNLVDIQNSIVFKSPFYLNSTNLFHQKLSISHQLEIYQSIAFLSDNELISKLEETYDDISFIKFFNIEPNEEAFNFKSIEGFIHNNIYPKEFISDENLIKLLKKGCKVDDTYYFFKYLDDIFREQNSETGVFNLNGEIFKNKKKSEDIFFDYGCQLIARVFLMAATNNYQTYQNLCKLFMSKIKYETLKTKSEFLKILDMIVPTIIEIELKVFIVKVRLLVENTPENLTLQLNKENLKINSVFLHTYNDIIKNSRLWTVVSTNLYDDEDFINRNFLIFKPSNNISDGESKLIKLFSTIHSKRDIIEELLILDEPEHGFHPLWKKKFIKAITSLIPIILNKNNEDKIQIIFTTHDPLTLSDMPNNNIVYLTKIRGKSKVLKGEERPKKSFGANITDLLADSFFIEDGLIGDFAKGKITGVIEWLNNENRNTEKKSEILKTIKIIDEPLIKIKLEEMYYSIFHDDYTLIKEKEFIKKRAIELGLLKEEND